MRISRIPRHGALNDASFSAQTFGDVVTSLSNPGARGEIVAGDVAETVGNLPKSEEMADFPYIKGFNYFPYGNQRCEQSEFPG